MPSASQETLNRYEKLGGEGPHDDQFALSYLAAHGWQLTRGFNWIPPAGVDEPEDISDDEATCLDFLFEEWDYGGVVWQEEVNA